MQPAPLPDPPVPSLLDRLAKHLDILYPQHDCQALASRIVDLFAADQTATTAPPTPRSPTPPLWSQSDCLLLTYGDSVREQDQPPLQTLHAFCEDYVGDAVSAVHILPFFPYSSDDGFAVEDYTQVDPQLGNWSDIQQLGQSYDLMFDLVINHVSSQHRWFKNFQQGREPGATYFHTVNPNADVSTVVRPRTSALLRPTETPTGLQHVWCTFSHDQVDLNFANPDVLLEIIDVIRGYLANGAKILRLDAIGYLWKQLGTSCIHLRETHEAVKLLRTLLDAVAPGTLLITETNVPNNENLTYFGNRNEAHIIYNFSLAPLILHALLSGTATYLQRWMRSMPPAPVGCTYLNFTASHDGIGMRPAEGLLSDEEQSQVVSAVKSFGGLISSRGTADGGERVYELNISFFDALKGTLAGVDAHQVERFLCSQTIALGIEGIPAIYIHSLLATPNDLAGVKETGRNRSINRHRWQYDALKSQLDDPQSTTSIVHAELTRRMRIRAAQPAFHPAATQFTLILDNHFFGFWRQSADRQQSIFAVHNLSNQPQPLSLEDLNLISTDRWWDLIEGTPMPGMYESLTLAPYQCLWITNSRP
ncbi:alpha-amylase family glycosyl hydrolase [Roseimaritima ulvae]|uniref:Sucrose phosphorylase n=1 Tax=Roseimaritima ulvae TaxID=980254 RepID=A0A5B9QXA6_9BACT|nr:alpha-amylase family glycosyl hydrolase [Roseimaritima ulvae]QEG42440.1 Sucrose phosphorylase [Roseimaritima ulvae]